MLQHTNTDLQFVHKTNIPTSLPVFLLQPILLSITDGSSKLTTAYTGIRGLPLTVSIPVSTKRDVLILLCINLNVSVNIMWVSQSIKCLFNSINQSLVMPIETSSDYDELNKSSILYLASQLLLDQLMTMATMLNLTVFHFIMHKNIDICDMMFKIFPFPV